MGIRFTDKDDYYPLVGAIRDVQRDGEWHTAEINLRQAISLAPAPDQ